ncbi:hypothetical protein [Desulfosporosinus metallidurans]|uniref:Uncharacterized protein n=1 Tax=Desulfosporosinus metallidurans TaxID=1888891 RepID=A0A1Q8QRK6_9FIRM|nr:hypothetical protein [Desulfosporosinus metallidurans]OLN29989.1 hypothetical protein DSOL_3329 [Desulfosporosinus metallidurans]
MLFQWLMVLIAVATLIVTFYSDLLTGKKKHSSYFQTVQTPTGKAEREAVIPNLNQYDSFYAKLNSL